jgi:hypothetical protein
MYRQAAHQISGGAKATRGSRGSHLSAGAGRTGSAYAITAADHARMTLARPSIASTAPRMRTNLSQIEV